MLFWLYNTVALILFILALPYFLYLFLAYKRHRLGIAQRFGYHSKKAIEKLSSDKKRIWIHCVSVGEVMSALPLIKKLSSDSTILFSVTTASGYEIAKNKSTAAYIFFYPFDFYFVVKKVFSLLRPNMVILFESEIWPNFIFEASSRKIPLLVLNGRISLRSQKRYKALSFFYASVLNKINFFGTQTSELAGFFKEMGVASKKVHVTGNLKFDMSIPHKISEMQPTSRLVLTAASTHLGEEEIFLEVFHELRKKYEDLLLVLVPRHAERIEEVKSIMRQDSYCQRGENPGSITELVEDRNISILLIDTFGELMEVYLHSTLVFLGKSLLPPGGGHNIIEPAIFEKVVLTGPYMDNFKEVTSIMKEKESIIQVADKKELKLKIEDLLSNSEKRSEVGNRAKEAVLQNQGALERNLAIIQKFLNA